MPNCLPRRRFGAKLCEYMLLQLDDKKLCSSSTGSEFSFPLFANWPYTFDFSFQQIRLHWVLREGTWTQGSPSWVVPYPGWCPPRCLVQKSALLAELQRIIWVRYRLLVGANVAGSNKWTSWESLSSIDGYRLRKLPVFLSQHSASTAQTVCVRWTLLELIPGLLTAVCGLHHRNVWARGQSVGVWWPELWWHAPWTGCQGDNEYHRRRGSWQGAFRSHDTKSTFCFIYWWKWPKPCACASHAVTNPNRGSTASAERVSNRGWVRAARPFAQAKNMTMVWFYCFLLRHNIVSDQVPPPPLNTSGQLLKFQRFDQDCPANFPDRDQDNHAPVVKILELLSRLLVLRGDWNMTIAQWMPCITASGWWYRSATMAERWCQLSKIQCRVQRDLRFVSCWVIRLFWILPKRLQTSSVWSTFWPGLFQEILKRQTNSQVSIKKW